MSLLILTQICLVRRRADSQKAMEADEIDHAVFIMPTRKSGLIGGTDCLAHTKYSVLLKSQSLVKTSRLKVADLGRWGMNP
jgi:hypothetical protein